MVGISERIAEFSVNLSKSGLFALIAAYIAWISGTAKGNWASSPQFETCLVRLVQINDSFSGKICMASAAGLLEACFRRFARAQKAWPRFGARCRAFVRNGNMATVHRSAGQF